MAKRILIILGAVLIVVVLVTIFLSLRKNASPSPPGSSQSSQESQKSLKVITTAPANNETNFRTDVAIRITFSKDIDASSFSIASSPVFTYKKAGLGNVLFITPIKQLQSQTQYKIKVSSSLLQAPYQFSFVTNASNPVDTNPGQAARQQQEQELKRVSPGAFLANHLPYSSQTFSMISGQNNNLLSFIVTENGPDFAQNKLDSLHFMESLGLTDDQIATLPITYITSDQANAVSKFKQTLPYYSSYLAIGYDKDSDMVTVTIDLANKSLGENNFKSLLSQYSINNSSWINNLTFVYN